MTMEEDIVDRNARRNEESDGNGGTNLTGRHGG